MLNSSNAIVLTMHHALAARQTLGFTLIELSIVLVIIGLIVGGILTGQDLISAAAQSAQVAQITKYNTAVNTFRLKYGALPGDISDPTASQFGFVARGTNRGEGDGNGIIEGYASRGVDYYGSEESVGETAVFWMDLSKAGLIDGGFNTASSTANPGVISGVTLNNYFPQAKIGAGNYVYVWSGGIGGITDNGDGNNYFSVAVIQNCDANGEMTSIHGLTVQQAYNIDKKIDDGLPQSGNVNTLHINITVPYTGAVAWAAGNGVFGADAGAPTHGPTNNATPYATTNCYDNNNVAGTQTYSLSQNASQINCALSFKFQ